MEDLKYFISESQRFRTAADYVQEEAMISRGGSPRAAPAAGPNFHGGEHRHNRIGGRTKCSLTLYYRDILTMILTNK